MGLNRQSFYGLLDAPHGALASKYFHHNEKRRRVGAATDGGAYGTEQLPGLQTRLVNERAYGWFHCLVIPRLQSCQHTAYTQQSSARFLSVHAFLDQQRCIIFNIIGIKERDCCSRFAQRAQALLFETE